jgi:DNA-binding transcriptional LysR family regulator
MDLRITLHKLEVFRLVVEEKSVTRAAERLFVAQPVVTAHIRSLEERIGARLFYREGRQLHLTEAGRAAHEYAQDVLTRTQELSRHVQALSDGTRGTVVLAASNSLGSYRLPSVLAHFRRQRPAVNLQLNIWDTEHALETTMSGVNDFAVVVAGTAPAGLGLATERLGDEELVVVSAPDAHAADEAISVEELGQLPFVETPAGLIRRSFVDEQLRRQGIGQRRIVMELGHAEALKSAVKAELGVALLFRSSVTRDLERGDLQEVRVKDFDIAIPVFLAYRKSKLFSALHEDLIDTIRRSFAAQPAARSATP